MRRIFGMKNFLIGSTIFFWPHFCFVLREDKVSRNILLSTKKNAEPAERARMKGRRHKYYFIRIYVPHVTATRRRPSFRRYWEVGSFDHWWASWRGGEWVAGFSSQLFLSISSSMYLLYVKHHDMYEYRINVQRRCYVYRRRRKDGG